MRLEPGIKLIPYRTAIKGRVGENYRRNPGAAQRFQSNKMKTENFSTELGITFEGNFVTAYIVSEGKKINANINREKAEISVLETHQFFLRDLLTNCFSRIMVKKKF